MFGKREPQVDIRLGISLRSRKLCSQRDEANHLHETAQFTHQKRYPVAIPITWPVVE